MAVPRAAVLVRPQPHYRHDAFIQGLRRCGFLVSGQAVADPRPGDVLVIWNRYGHWNRQAELYEKAGARVLVAENGYLGKDREGRQFYALAIGGHNGSGRWHVGGAERWDALGIKLEPWRSGRHILVRGQRGIGTALMASPDRWHFKMAEWLKARTDREVIIRHHPESPEAKATKQPSLEDQLIGCHALVSWASSDVGRALVAGVPAFVLAPHHVLDPVVERDLARLENPIRAERMAGFRRLAWAQWSVAEIESGAPFRYLMEVP